MEEKKTGFKQIQNLKAFLDYHKQLMMSMKFVKLKSNKETTSSNMIADTEANKKLNPIVTDLFFRGRKINILTCFYTTILFQSSYLLL